MTAFYEWSDGDRNGGRKSHLFLVDKTGDVTVFRGQDIPGLAVIAGQRHVPNGKWSETISRLALREGVTPVDVTNPLHRCWVDEFASRTEAIEWFEKLLGRSFSAPSFFTAMEAVWPKRWANLLEREAQIAELDDQEEGEAEVKIVNLTFGNPTNAQIAEGWWSSPKEQGDVAIELVDEPSWKIARVDHIRVVDPQTRERLSAKVLSVETSPGHHGGYVTVRVAVAY